MCIWAHNFGSFSSQCVMDLNSELQLRQESTQKDAGAAVGLDCSKDYSKDGALWKMGSDKWRQSTRDFMGA